MNKNVSDRAKPCPLCGGKDIYIKVGDLNPIYAMYIACSNCGLKGFKNFLKRVPTYEGEARLIDYWNTRKETENEKDSSNM